MLNPDLKRLPDPVKYTDRVMLIGSCFTEHIGNALADLKFRVLQNPDGILFGPDSVCSSLQGVIDNIEIRKEDLFELNEVWHSWLHHSRFSGINPQKAAEGMNHSRQQAHSFLKEADWLIITLGSAFTYRLTEQAAKASLSTGDSVANCHRAPASWFTKELMQINDIVHQLKKLLQSLKAFNPGIRLLFTISPVRHIRDGVVENNRSKARLIEAVHQITTEHTCCYYFPAYELVIDVLRDYRFFDIDMVHPNYAATEFVLEKFSETCVEEETRVLMQEVKKINIARRHKPFQPATSAHRQFLAAHALKVKQLMEQYPFLDLQEELAYFNQQ